MVGIQSVEWLSTILGPLLSMQGALKEPASRFGPVVSSSPPRISKSGRAVHVQHPKSGLATEHAESKLCVMLTLSLAFRV